MLHAFSNIVLLAQLAVAPMVHAPSRVPFDTVVAAPAARVALTIESGGAVRVVGGETRVVRVKVTERGKHCADCIVSVYQTPNGLEVRTGRTRAHDRAADLRIELEVPMRTDVTVTSAGGQVDIEGIDGTVSGTTEFGALNLLRLSGPLLLETKRGDVTLRQSYVRGRVHTNAGRVLLEDVGGNVRGTTARGSVVERRVERVPTAP
jgi:hypothetical protein